MKVDRLRSWAAAIFLVLCLALGGASARGAGVAVNALLQIIALFLILFSLWTRIRRPFPGAAKAVVWIALLFLLLVLSSLLPLPPSVWEQLPGRQPIARGFRLLESGLPSLPVSLDWNRSVISVLSLLPPIAMFLLVLDSSLRERRRLLWIVLGMAVVSIGLGAGQLLSGPDTWLRFYDRTTAGYPVGFFANANHLATLLLCALPVAGYVAARARTQKQKQMRGSGMITAGSIAIFLLVGIAIIGSLAGYALALPTALATALIYRRAAHGPLSRRWIGAAAVTFFAFVGLAVAGPLNEQALSKKLNEQPTSRAVIAETTTEAIRDFFPIGSGLGTFADIYRMYDDPNRASQTFVNHAHNDYLEVALELGLPGVLLVLGFLIWWLSRTYNVWRTEFEGSSLARWGSVVVFVVLLHSLVDYPIRTTAIAALFATACAFLVAYLPRSTRKQTTEGEARQPLRHLEA